MSVDNHQSLQVQARGPFLHHLALGARDVAGVARFYQRLFGLVSLKRHLYPGGALRSVWLDLSPGILMIEHTEERRDPVDGVGVGPFLVAFHMEDSQAMEELLTELEVPIETRTTWSLYFRDPEGNRVAASRFPQETFP